MTLPRERLVNSPSTQIEQVLKDVPGLQLFRRSDARSSHPTSQGITLRALGGNASSRALLILDGVPQADPFGGWVNWPAYDPTSIGEIRVIRGGGSVGYSPGSLAGTIEMTTWMEDALSAGVEAGSRESVEGRLFAGLPVGGGRFVLSARGARGDGFIPVTEGTRGPVDRPAPYRTGSLRAFWVAPVASGVDLQLGALAFTDRRDRGVDFTANRTDGGDFSARLVGRGKWQWSTLLYGQLRELRSSFASVNDDRSAAMRVANQYSVPSHSLGASFELRPPMPRGIEVRFGGDARLADGESREFFSYVAGEPTRRRRAGGKSLTAGLFGELTAELGRLSVSGGARIDHWRISDGVLVERVIASGETLRDDRYPSRSGWLPTTRAGIVYDAGRGLSLRSAAYLGWRLSTLNELFRPFRAGADATAANPFLDPERLLGAEAGIDYRRAGLTLSATAFANNLKDSIANVTLGQGPGVFPGVGFVPSGGNYRQRQNLDSVRVQGIEASAKLRQGAVSGLIAGSYTDAEVRSTGAASVLDGMRPAQTPRLALTGSLSWERDRRAASIVVRHVGAQFEDDLNIESLPSATTVDLFLAWPISRALQAVVRAENLFDELVVAGLGNDDSVERATPRTVWIGLRFARP
ncbi:MAG TPA: TonB-dependent receptor [Thermoanaerobaculia bacterium]|nr:TonB-dependent receptor [Thermoanaerobaculia bacterium]